MIPCDVLFLHFGLFHVHVFACCSHVRHMVFSFVNFIRDPKQPTNAIIGKVPIKNQRHAVPSSLFVVL